jgi:transcriptional regulator with XRE-family HTH domain
MPPRAPKEPRPGPRKHRSLIVPCLRHVLASRRMEAGYSLRHVAQGSHVSYSQLSRFETGHSYGDVDAMVDAYAHTLHVTPREIWAETLNLYTKDPEGIIAALALEGRGAAEALADDVDDSGQDE